MTPLLPVINALQTEGCNQTEDRKDENSQDSCYTSIKQHLSIEGNFIQYINKITVTRRQKLGILERCVSTHLTRGR